MGREAIVSDSTRTQDQTAATRNACSFDTEVDDPNVPPRIVWPKIERDSSLMVDFLPVKKLNIPKAA